MISHEEIKDLVFEWGLREDVLEKDYVLSWILWGIGSDPVLADTWVFKGGTCLKKCFLETYRFSEDLDFTVKVAGPLTPEEVLPAMEKLLARVGEASGIDFTVRTPRFRSRQNALSTEGRVYYRGPRQAPTPASVKLDLSQNEVLIRPPVMRPIMHLFSDRLPDPATVQTYAYEEVFAEKIRAMGERCRPRDLYDIIHLFRRAELRNQPGLIRDVLEAKCEFKGIGIPSLDLLGSSPYRQELESEWENMLGHQLQALPPIEPNWNELQALFAWLEGETIPEPLAPFAHQKDEDRAWSPPPTLASWHVGVPLEGVRFAAVNRLCVELGYQGTVRVIEPYALRQTLAGDLVFHAVRTDNREHRSYRVDRIESVRITDRPFTPVYEIEFSAERVLSAPPTARRGTGLQTGRKPRSRKLSNTGPTYIIECPVCQKKFRRKTHDTKLRPHKTPDGWACSGRTGYLVETVYS